MTDTYYINLARSVLNNAHKNLSDVQGYLRDAKLDEEREYTQRIINQVRTQLDRLATYKEEDD